MPLRILSGTLVRQQPAHERSPNPPAAVLQHVRGDGRGQGDGHDHDDRQHAAVAEDRQPQRAEERARRIEDEAGLAGVEAERLEAVVKVEAVGGSPTRARLLKERKIDMGLQPYPLSYEAEAEGFSNLGAMAKLVPDYQFVSVMVDETWASKNRAVLAAFLKALRRGTEYMFAHPDESAELGAKELRTSPAFARRALEDTLSMDIMSRDLSLADASLQRVFNIMQQAGVLARDVPFEPAKFVDESYLPESRK